MDKSRRDLQQRQLLFKALEGKLPDPWIVHDIEPETWKLKEEEPDQEMLRENILQIRGEIMYSEDGFGRPMRDRLAMAARTLLTEQARIALDEASMGEPLELEDIAYAMMAEVQHEGHCVVLLRDEPFDVPESMSALAHVLTLKVQVQRTDGEDNDALVERIVKLLENIEEAMDRLFTYPQGGAG